MLQTKMRAWSSTRYTATAALPTQPKGIGAARMKSTAATPSSSSRRECRTDRLLKDRTVYLFFAVIKYKYLTT
jgi:hypothetical protein